MSGPHVSVAFLLEMQRKVGNQAILRLLNRKMSVGVPRASSLVVVEPIETPVVEEIDLAAAPEPVLVVKPETSLVVPRPGFLRRLWLILLRFLRLKPQEPRGTS